MKSTFFSLALALALFTGKVYTADKCHLREVDLCAVPIASTNKVPATEEEIDKYCAIATEAKQCLENYLAQCSTPIQREVYAWATKDPLKNTADFCEKGSTQRNDYLKYAPCLVKAQSEGKQCTDDIHAALEKLETATFADRIPTACCIYHRYEKCVSDIVETHCGKEAVTLATEIVQRHAGVSPQIICHGFDGSSDQCKNLLPPPGTKASGNAKSLLGRLFSLYVS